MKLFVFGLGYSASHVAKRLAARGATISGTVRTPDNAAALVAAGYSMHVFAGARDDVLAAALSDCDAVLISVPPGTAQDPVLSVYRDDLLAAPNLRWIGYLSTIGVYGDQDGGWVDETTPPDPSSDRSRRRIAAERDWLALGTTRGVPVQIFRLAGIYGPGRNQLVQLAQGSARRVIKPGQVFNRIHVEDIAQTIEASLARPCAGAVYNVADSEPAPPQDVVAFAAALCSVEPPPEIPFAQAELSDMSRSFFGDNKRVRNRLLMDELGVTLRYPTYREGLTALRKAGEGPHAR